MHQNLRMDGLVHMINPPVFFRKRTEWRTHFKYPAEDTLTQPVLQFFTREIGRDDHRLAISITFIDNQIESVEHKIRTHLGTYIIEHQHIDRRDLLKQVILGDLASL